MTSWGDQKYIKFPFVKIQNIKPINGLASNAISIGTDAGFTNQGSSSIAIGDYAGFTNQGSSSIAIGNNAGYKDQGVYSVAIGYEAGKNNTVVISDYYVALGYQAGNDYIATNSIILNGSGTPLQSYNSGFHVKPIRNVYFNKMLVYDLSNCEITYDDNPFSPGVITPTCRLINNIEGINFCDGSYIGEGTSFDMSFNDIVNITAIRNQGSTYNGASIVTNKRINQTINSGTTWEDVNGYYSLSKDSYPSVSSAYSTLAVSQWTLRPVPDTRSYISICWSPELRLFVAGAVSNVGRMITSPDGITWTLTSPTFTNNSWGSISWSKKLNLFVTVSYDGGTNRAAWSSDGVGWNTVSTISAPWRSVCWSKELEKFVAVASAGSPGQPNNRVMTSLSGTSWTPHTISSPIGAWRSVCWAKELEIFVAVGDTGATMWSYDGITWSSGTGALSLNWKSVCWSSPLGLFVAVSNNPSGGNGVMYSYNGVVWNSASGIVNNFWNSVCWSNELEIFVAVGIDNNVPLDCIMYSRNGIVWNVVTSGGSNDWEAICWSPELGIFTAVSSTGTSGTPNERVFTSSFKGRPPTAYNVFDNSFNSIDQNGSWTVTKRFNTIGGIKMASNYQTAASYILLETDYAVTFNGTTTATLPIIAPINVGQQYLITNINASALTVNSSSSQLIYQTGVFPAVTTKSLNQGSTFMFTAIQDSATPTYGWSMQ